MELLNHGSGPKSEKLMGVGIGLPQKTKMGMGRLGVVGEVIP